MGIKIYSHVRTAHNRPGKLYLPSNATELMIFMGAMCEGCTKDNGEGCNILNHIMAGDDRKEWVIDEDGQPICTAFKSPKDKPAVPRCKSTIDMFE